MAEDDKKVKLARGIVARGRTVMAPHLTETEIKGVNQETGKVIRGPKLIEHGPDTEVTLPSDEIEGLRALGFLVDPNSRATIAPYEGARVTESS